MKARPLWVIVNAASGKQVEHLGTHGSKSAAQAMLDQHLASYSVDIIKKILRFASANLKMTCNLRLIISLHLHQTGMSRRTLGELRRTFVSR